MSREKRTESGSDLMLEPGESQRQVGLMQALYRKPECIGQCQPCRGMGRITVRGGASQACPKCKGRGRL